MKEFLEGANQAFLTIPENIRDRATVRFANFYLMSGRNHGLSTPKRRGQGAELLNRWYMGKPTPLAEYAPKLFDPSSFRIKGAEQILQDPGIVVVNQTNEGPLRGNWLKFVIPYAIIKNGRESGSVRWVQKEESSNALLQQSPLGVQKSRLSQMIARSCNTILVNENSSPRQNMRALAEMKRHLDQNGILIICPEGVDSSMLKRGKAESGQLIKMLAKRKNLPIYPAAVHFSDELLHLQFASPIKFSEMYGATISDQQMADRLMIETARLLPPQKRGFYASYT